MNLSKPFSALMQRIADRLPVGKSARLAAVELCARDEQIEQLQNQLKKAHEQNADLQEQNILLTLRLATDNTIADTVVHDLRNALALLYEKSITDARTGLYSPQAEDRILTKITAAAQYNSGPNRRADDTSKSFAVIAIDIDKFKTINDYYGHDQGDATLVAIADQIRECIRKDDEGKPTDFAMRSGGEELLVIAPCATSDAPTVAELVAGRIRTAIESNCAFMANDERDPFIDNGQRVVTASIGTAILTPHLASDETIEPQYRAALKRADRALYASKQAGRNRITHADFETAETPSVRLIVASARPALTR